MRQNEETPVTAKKARAMLGWGSSYMSAVRRAMGISSRYFFLSDVRKFIRDNPNFTSSQVYHLGGCDCNACQAKKAKSGKMNSLPTCSAQVPTTSPEPNQWNSPEPTGNEPKVNYFKLFGQKFIALRGQREAKAIHQKAGLSRETLRKAERGKPPLLKNLRRLAEGVGMSEQERLEVTVLWVKIHLGEDAARIRIEVETPENDSPHSQNGSRWKEFTDYFMSLGAVQQRMVIDLIKNKAMLSGLFDFKSKAVEAATPRELHCNGQAIPAANPEAPIHDLWAAY